jgi:trimeric autotransporter adhesin
MRKNYFNVFNNNFIEVLQLRNRLSKLFLFLGFIVLSLNSYGQDNAADPVPFVSTNFANLSVSKNTTATLCIGCGISNEGNLIDNSLTNYATASTGALSVGVVNTLRVTDGTLNKTYVAGSFAGFKIGTGSQVLSLDLLNGITIKTYLDGVLQDSNSGNSLLGLSLLSGTNESLVGFNTLKPFDAIEIVLNGTVSLLSATDVFYAVIKEYSAGPDLDCNTATKLSSPIFPVTANAAISGVTVGSISNVENTINSNDADYATVSFLLSVAGSATIAIKDQVEDYSAGTYAGFEIEKEGLLNVSILDKMVISTYLNGVFAESFSANDLVANVGLLPSSGRFKLGFVSTKDFDEIQLTFDQIVGLNLGTTRVYGAIFEKFCETNEVLACNVKTALTAPAYPVYVNSANSGIDATVCVGCAIENQDNLIDADLNNYAEVNLTVGVGSTASLSVKEQITDYPAGTFAGYAIENPALLNVDALGSVTITTYLNGGFQESKLANDPLVSVGTDLLVGSGRQTIGFVTTKDFDEVKISFENVASINLGQIKVYGVVFEKFCEGPELDCNVQTAMTAPLYPVFVNSKNTGTNGVLCVACKVVDQDNLVDTDPNNYAQVDLAVGVGGSGSLSVKNQITDYPAGTYAGYTIENPALLTVDALKSIIVTTYLNGEFKESKIVNKPLVSVGTDLLVTTGKQTVGFVTTMPFDEVKITFESLASVNLGIIKVYNAVFQKLCDPVVECNKTYTWSNPIFPVTVKDDRTGLEGIACVSCAVKDTDNLLTASETDFANITLAAGVLASGSVSVKDELFTYPKGTFAGYVIKDLGTLAQVNLLQSLTITTYNNGVLQEDSTQGQLIDLSLLGIEVLGSVPGVYNIGFKSTKPFDEIRLTLSSVASVINSINVYGAFVNTSESDGGSGSGLECNTSAITVGKDGIYVDANSDGIVNVGDKIDYTFDIKNTGFETLTKVSLTDNNATVVGTPITTLAAGANDKTSYAATYAITQADIDAGVVYNLATVIATTNIGTEITATSTDPTPCASCPVNPTCVDCTATPIAQTNSIALVKTGNTTGTAVLGDVINYTFSVTNTGNTTLTNVVVTDPMTGLVISGSPIASLAPGVTDNSIKGIYVITQADINAGKVTNSALVTTKDPQNNDVTDVSGTTITTDDATETPVDQTSTIALVKTAEVGGAGGLGDTITYTFAVTNTGTTTLTNVVVTDPMLGLIITGSPIASLAPGVTNISLTGTYIITQDDVDAGKVVNQATVTAKDPQNNDVTDISGSTITTDDATETPIGQRSTIALVKTGSIGGTGTGLLGETITYTFAVTNTGTTTLTAIEVTDPMVGLIITGSPIASLAPGDTDTSVTGTYIITQADIDAGKVINQATVTAKDPSNNDVTDISGTTKGTNDTTQTPVTQTSSIALMKTASIGGTGTGLLGEVITYTFTVQNTGRTTIKNILVTDPMAGLNITGNPIATLAPGITNATIKGTYTITQADIDAGKVTNTALVTAKDPQNNNVTDVSGTTLATNDATETPVTQNPSIALMKTAVVGGTGVLNDVITYTFTVKNTGNTTLTNVVVTDPMVGLNITGSPIATLAPGVTNATIKGTYTITQADIDAGKVSNSALATAKDPQNNDITDVSGTTLTTDDSTDTPLTQNTSIALMKTAVVGGTGVLNDVITYTFTVKNTGNTTLTNVVVTDPMVGLNITGSPIASLAPGVTNTTIKGTYTITQADIDTGKVTNSATVTAKDPQNNDITDVSGTTLTTDDTTDTPVTHNSSIALMKTAVVGGTGVLNDIITYTFTVKNTGNTTLTNVVVTDPMVGLTITGSPIASLAPGVTNTTIKGSYTITQVDIDAGKVTNSALATAKDPQNNDVTDISGTTLTTDDATDTPLVPKNASIALMKVASVSGTRVSGDVITYTFTVKNTGNVTLSNVIVTDPMVGLTITGSPIMSLAPGATNTSITGTYVITMVDAVAGKVTNSALATAQDPQGVNVTDRSGTTLTTDDATETPITQTTSISVTKSGVYVDANNDGIANLGDYINYTFIVKNTGETSLSDVMIIDNKVTIVGDPIPTLAYNASNSSAFTATYNITQDDINAGVVYNLATVEGIPPIGPKVTNTSTDPTPYPTEYFNPSCPTCTVTLIPQSPKIALMLTGEFQDENMDGQAQIGETIKYTYTIMNMGNVPLSNVWIDDAMAGLDMNSGVISMPIGAMDSTTFYASYSITQEDIVAGNVTNQATVYGTSPLGVVVQDMSDDDSPLEDDGTVIGVEGCILNVFNAVSPNVGEDYQRILYIRGMDCYPNNSVQIFDRWGVKVFDVDGYDNNTKAFRGVSDGRATVSQSKSLPSGTYFYVIKYVDKDGKGYNKAGYLHLIND